MSQMPSKIWLHKDTKYSTGDMVCGYQYDFVQGIEDEGGIENFVEYVPADTFIEKAITWLKETITNNPECDRIISKKGVITMGELIDVFRNYMEGE